MGLYNSLKTGFYIALASTIIGSNINCASTRSEISPLDKETYELEGKSITIKKRYKLNEKEHIECTKLHGELGAGLKGLEKEVQTDENLLKKINEAIESQDESLIAKLNREIDEEIEKQKKYNGILGLGITTGYPLLDWGIIAFIGGSIWGQDEYRKQHHEHKPSTSQSHGGGPGTGGGGGN